MRKIKVLSVLGTRTEGIKMCPLVKRLESDERFESIVCVTAQQREMLDNVLEIFNVKQDYDLNIMKHGQTIIDISNKVLSGVDEVIKNTTPDIVLVHGDTSTTLNAALAGFYNKIPIGHVEAGLRSHGIYSSFPEEVNRKLTGCLATMHFAPTDTNKKNLLEEGVSEESIYVTGNTVIDALLGVIDKKIIFEQEILNEINFEERDVILLTTHRRGNLGKPMENIFEAMIKLLNSNDKVDVIFPMHKNPRIRELAHRYFDIYKERVHLIEPLEYVEFANLMERVKLIMTDSGGIQEEAPTLGKPALVLRSETERPEAVQAGTIKLARVETECIYNLSKELLENKDEYKKIVNARNPYGDGTSCLKILDRIYEYFN